MTTESSLAASVELNDVISFHNVSLDDRDIPVIPNSKRALDVESGNVHLLRVQRQNRLLRQESRPYPPPKTTVVAFLLTVIGFVFLITGLSIYFGPPDIADHGLPILIIGGIMFIPGSYASFILFGAWRGWRGYDYNQITSYDND